jgi:hypothetical protein
VALGDGRFGKFPLKIIYRKYQKQRHYLSPVIRRVPMGISFCLNGMGRS